MRITFRDDVYIAISDYSERTILRQAGFSFHAGLDECKAGPHTCAACQRNIKRAWWTRRSEVAVRLYEFADDKAKAALTSHIEAVSDSRALSADIEIPTPRGLAFMPYQKAGIKYMLDRPAVLLGDEMGLGKTPQALGVINYDQSIKNVLVVCPAALRINWHREAKRWLTKDSRDWFFYIIDRDTPIPEKANFIIGNYNRVGVGYRTCDGPCGGEKKRGITCPDCDGSGESPTSLTPGVACKRCKGEKLVFCPKCNGRGKMPALNLKIVKSLYERKFDLLIADECHFIKNPDAQRTRALIGNPRRCVPGLVDNSRKKLFLTGTPLPNKPSELWPVLSVCSPKDFGNFHLFAKLYCAAHEEWISESKKVWNTGGASNLERLQEKMRSTCLVRRLKKDVLKELPPKTRQIIPLEPDEKAKKIIAQELAIWNKKFGSDMTYVNQVLSVAQETRDEAAYAQAVEKLQYIQRVAFMEMAKVRHDLAVAKIPAVKKHITRLFDEGCEKLICFAHHKDVIHALEDEFKDICVSFYGDTGMEERQKAVDGFQTDPKVKLFIGGIMAAGTGLTLTAASTGVFAELDWTPSTVTQAEDRLHRIGQKDAVLIQHLVFDGSLDARMAQMLVEKQSIADQALDKPTSIELKTMVSKLGPEEPILPVAIWKKILLKKALEAVAKSRGNTDDGGHGFSKFDMIVGNSLATFEGDFSDKQAHLGLKIAKKYRRQISCEMQKQLEIYEEPNPVEERRRRMKSGQPRPPEPEQSCLELIFTPLDTVMENQ
jgi:hypothetical protein